MSIKLEGNWKNGFAFDVHTLSSTYLGVNESGHDQWDNTRSEIGELLYQLKYRSDGTVIQQIVKLLDKITGIETMDYIIPVPSSNQLRRLQPVIEIARSLGSHRNVAVIEDVLCKKAGGPELKNVTDIKERERLLEERLYLQQSDGIKGRNILLIDDLYRSGATLRAATRLLYERAEVQNVYVLTMTKTRSNR